MVAREEEESKERKEAHYMVERGTSPVQEGSLTEAVKRKDEKTESFLRPTLPPLSLLDAPPPRWGRRESSSFSREKRVSAVQGWGARGGGGILRITDNRYPVDFSCLLPHLPSCEVSGV